MEVIIFRAVGLFVGTNLNFIKIFSGCAVFGLTRIWYLVYIRRQIILIGPLRSLLILRRVGDFGWVEVFGGQGAYRVVLRVGQGVDFYQRFRMKVYLIGFIL